MTPPWRCVHNSRVIRAIFATLIIASIAVPLQAAERRDIGLSQSGARIEAFFVEEVDDKVNPIGVKGIGEVGYVGVAPAVANAVFHATGKRIRTLPITLDKLM